MAKNKNTSRDVEHVEGAGMDGVDRSSHPVVEDITDYGSLPGGKKDLRPGEARDNGQTQGL